jgi:hypothetical protein
MSNRQLLTSSRWLRGTQRGYRARVSGLPSWLLLLVFSGSAAVIWLAGLIFRPAHNYARMRVDSIAVVATCLVGVAGLIALQ